MTDTGDPTDLRKWMAQRGFKRLVAWGNHIMVCEPCRYNNACPLGIKYGHQTVSGLNEPAGE